MPTLSLDFETRSPIDLKAAGVYRYAENAEVLCLAYAFDDDEEPAIWTPADIWLPYRIVNHIEARGELRAWNAGFERVIWRAVMQRQHGAPEVLPEQWHDTAAEAAAMALPRSLDLCAEALGVAEQKDQEGYNLMRKLSKPQTGPDDPAKLARLYDYCKQDVRVEQAIAKRLHRLPPIERSVYLLDQRINDRGVRLDLPLIHAAKVAVNQATAEADAALHRLTGGAVTAVSNTGQLREYLQVDSVSKPAVAELLASEHVPEHAKAALRIRAEAGRSSVAKLDTMLECVCEDGRARGLLLYHGASTGRWAGKLIQPQNFPRGDVAHPEQYITPLMAGRTVPNAMAVVSSLLRGTIIPSVGARFLCGDYSAIEARVLNWFAGQEDMLALFQKYDAAPDEEKPLYDPYRHNAARLYKMALVDVQKHPHRQTGKFQELGCGFGMGPKKAVTAAKTIYQLDLTPEQAAVIVADYRRTHSKVVQLWYEMERACMRAVAEPGNVQHFARGHLRALVRGNYLYVLLPAHRALVYAAPSLVDATTPWGEIKQQIEISAVDSYTKKWERCRVYGGLLVENAVQATARDLMAAAMLRLEERGYDPVLSVHDEVLTERAVGSGTLQEFKEVMEQVPEWATGCPISVDAWEGERYRKG